MSSSSQIHYADKISSEFKRDETLNRARLYTSRGLRALPSSTLDYFLEKSPVIQWLPKFSPKWLLNDFAAGLTVGVLLTPQSLAYAKIATIPGQFGLMASWIPGLVYFAMGTSKDISVGPTSLIGLLTAEIVKDVSGLGYSPQAIAFAVALMMDTYASIMGLFKLGFLLEFISVPVLTGFVSATAIVILLGQVPSLFGGMNVGKGTANIIHDTFSQLGKSQPPTVLVGFSGLLLLVILQLIAKRWGKKSKITWFIGISRSAVVLIIFTGISFAINKDFKKPLFDISKVKSDGITAPKLPDFALVKLVATQSVSPFVAAALEHLAIAKGFARKNNYVIDESQELVTLGSINFLNSVFSGMGAGGAMSRTAVNSETGVKSPLGGLITAGFVLLSIFKLSPALFWIPNATLAAIIITAVFHIISPPSVFYRYWKTSLADFIASMTSFWVTLFVGTEVGIGSAVAFSIIYTLLKAAFARVHLLDPLTLPPPVLQDYISTSGIPPGTKVFRFQEAIIFFSAYHVKRLALDLIQTYNSGSTQPAASSSSDSSWSVSSTARIKRLRSRAGLSPVDPPPPRTRVVVLDMSGASYMDTTGLLALGDLKSDFKAYGGEEVEIRFVGMGNELRRKFERASWEGVHLVYDSVSAAVNKGYRYSGRGMGKEEKVQVVSGGV